ncbi:MAG: alcohol dehydrogenase [Gammaproteobacteria bacterium]|jgi:threonine dehydrogenase-like Zn-dependent dehydrogenase|nr:alcohol dehydrogenase [Gammaproteobacteria bacterium]MBK81808.1 alcohol dehydrogenase [Gammaproteobacteria bacterium]|tara:strand:- start:18500 stop:19591 length:1092 start_codon:yes stop_codon:yes gene_type:complete
MLPRKSFAMVQTGVRTLEPREVEIPDIDAFSAILELEACGICGSDYEQYEGALRTPMPVIPGHEPLGRIARIGDVAAERWGVDVGDRVAVETMLSCRHCPTCFDGRYHLCENRRIYSYIPLDESPGLWGGYAQYMYLHANSVIHRVDPSLPAELAVMFNPLGAGFRWAVELPETKPGESVVILGPGQRGLSSVIACREVGAGTIVVTGLAADARKLELARAFGADHTIDVDNEPAVERVKALTDGGADVVVDVSAYATQPVRDALDMVKPGGRIVLAGVKGFKPVDDFVSDLIVMKEVTIHGAIGVTSSGYRSAIRLIESGRSPIGQMHTHDFPLENADLAIRTLAREVENDESIHSCLIPPK